MRCLVIGDTGFVGSALATELRAREHEVLGVSRRPSGVDNVPHLQADVGDPDAIAAAAKGCEVVFHCGGVASARADRRALEWINIAGTENVIQAARHAGVRRVVYLSCADVSLVHADRIHWSETRALTAQPLDRHARTKLLAEELALSASDLRMEVTAIRPAWLWGPGDHTTLPWLCAEASRGGVRLHGSGDNLLAALYIGNLLPALITAATAPAAPGRAYYVADQEPLTAREFFTALCQACGLQAPRRGVYALDLAAAYVIERLQGRDGVVSDVVRRARGSLFDVQAAVRDLNFAPTISMETGMRALGAWVREQDGPSAITKLCCAPIAANVVDAQVRRATEPVNDGPATR